MTVIGRHLPPPFAERFQRPHAQLRLSPHRDRKVASCEVRFVPLGTEVRMLRNRYPIPVEASVGLGVLSRAAATIVGAVSWDYDETWWGVFVLEGEFNAPSEPEPCQASDAPDSCVDAAVLGGLRFRRAPHASSGTKPFASILLGTYWKGSGAADRDFVSDHFAVQIGGGVEIRWPRSIQGVRLSLDYRRIFERDGDANQLRGSYVIGPRRFMRASS
jgi:hypothetical protein